VPNSQEGDRCSRVLHAAVFLVGGGLTVRPLHVTVFGIAACCHIVSFSFLGREMGQGAVADVLSMLLIVVHIVAAFNRIRR